MDSAKNKALLETAKSIGRGLWFGVLGLFVVALTTFATSGAVSNVSVTVGGLTVNLAVMIVAIVGFIAKAIDTYIHKNENIASNGIAPAFLQGDSTTEQQAVIVEPTQPADAPQKQSTPTAIELPHENSQPEIGS